MAVVSRIGLDDLPFWGEGGFVNAAVMLQTAD